MNEADIQYLNLLRKLREEGVYREGRNGGTYGLFGAQMRFNLQDGFPLLTTKKVHFKSIMVELLWFIKGLTNTQYLHDFGVTIWDEWADENGNLGPVYGAQWRSWPNYILESHNGMYYKDTIDQLKNVINSIKTDPYSRRHIVTAWNPAEVDNMALPPCHCLFQFHVANGKLSCELYQRSADWFLGVPFNIASYALLTHLVARECHLEVGDFIHTFGDYHLYGDHLEAADEQLSRFPYELPKLVIRPDANHIFTMEPMDISIEGYQSHPTIKAEVSK